MIEAGAPIHTKTIQRRTALHFAAETGMKSLAETLFARGASIEDRDESGRTPVELAEAFPELQSLFTVRRDENIRTAIHAAKQLLELKSIQSELSERGQFLAYRGEIHSRIWELLETQLGTSMTVAEVHNFNKKLQNHFPKVDPNSYVDRIKTRIAQIVNASADPSTHSQTGSELSDNLILAEQNFPDIVTDELRHQILDKMRPLFFHEIQSLSSLENLQKHLNNRTNRHPGLLDEAMRLEYQIKAFPFIEQLIDEANTFELVTTAFQSSYAFWPPDQVPEALKQKASEVYVRVLPEAIRSAQTLEQLQRIQNDLIGLMHANFLNYTALKTEILAKVHEISLLEIEATSGLVPLAQCKRKILEIYRLVNPQALVPHDLWDRLSNQARKYLISSEFAHVVSVEQLVQLKRAVLFLFLDEPNVREWLKEREREWISAHLEKSDRYLSIVRLIDQLEVNFPEHLREALDEKIRARVEPLALAELEGRKSENELLEFKTILKKHARPLPISSALEEQLERKIQVVTHQRLEKFIEESGVVLRPPVRKKPVEAFPDAVCVSCFESESPELPLHRGPADCSCFRYCESDAMGLLQSTLQHSEEEVGFCPSCQQLLDPAFFRRAGCDSKKIKSLEDLQLRQKLCRIEGWQFCRGKDGACINGKIVCDDKDRYHRCLLCNFEGCLECGKVHSPLLNCSDGATDEAIKMILAKGARARSIPAPTDPFADDFEYGKYRDCPFPDCRQIMERVDGCNAMTCTSCGRRFHWNYGIYRNELGEVIHPPHDYNPGPKGWSSEPAPGGRKPHF